MTHVLELWRNGGIVALHGTGQNGILVQSINLGNTLRNNNNYLYNLRYGAIAYEEATRYDPVPRVEPLPLQAGLCTLSQWFLKQLKHVA